MGLSDECEAFGAESIYCYYDGDWRAGVDGAEAGLGANDGGYDLLGLRVLRTFLVVVRSLSVMVWLVAVCVTVWQVLIALLGMVVRRV